MFVCVKYFTCQQVRLCKVKLISPYCYANQVFFSNFCYKEKCNLIRNVNKEKKVVYKTEQTLSALTAQNNFLYARVYRLPGVQVLCL